MARTKKVEHQLDEYLEEQVLADVIAGKTTQLPPENSVFSRVQHEHCTAIDEADDDSASDSQATLSDAGFPELPTMDQVTPSVVTNRAPPMVHFRAPFVRSHHPNSTPMPFDPVFTVPPAASSFRPDTQQDAEGPVDGNPNANPLPANPIPAAVPSFQIDDDEILSRLPEEMRKDLVWEMNDRPYGMERADQKERAEGDLLPRIMDKIEAIKKEIWQERGLWDPQVDGAEERDTRKKMGKMLKMFCEKEGIPEEDVTPDELKKPELSRLAVPTRGTGHGPARGRGRGRGNFLNRSVPTHAGPTRDETARLVAVSNARAAAPARARRGPCRPRSRGRGS